LSRDDEVWTKVAAVQAKLKESRSAQEQNHNVAKKVIKALEKRLS